MTVLDSASVGEVGGETMIMRRLIDAWAKARWPGARMIAELCLGDRRADMVMVTETDIVAIEIKSSIDTLERLGPQIAEYQRFAPEVWIALAPKWFGHKDLPRWQNELVVDAKGKTIKLPGHRERRWKARRDDLVCSRLVELLHHGEMMRIASRMNILMPINVRMPKEKIAPLLARLMTGNEIIKEVCRELRCRSLVGIGSDAPIYVGEK